MRVRTRLVHTSWKLLVKDRDRDGCRLTPLDERLCARVHAQSIESLRSRWPECEGQLAIW
eukprot:528215-Prymnesium_polylepis.1